MSDQKEANTAATIENDVTDATVKENTTEDETNTDVEQITGTVAAAGIETKIEHYQSKRSERRHYKEADEIEDVSVEENASDNGEAEIDVEKTTKEEVEPKTDDDKSKRNRRHFPGSTTTAMKFFRRKAKQICFEKTSPDEPGETLCVSNQNHQTSKDITLIGRRRIDVGYFFSRLRQIDNQGLFSCSLENMIVVYEIRKGLRTGIELKCSMCFFTEIIWSENSNSRKMPVNTAAVSDIMATGGGYSNLEDILSAQDIPSMTSCTFQMEHDRISAAWEEMATKEMHDAAMEDVWR
ncbi:hypothetical protein HNY73_001413 [Argiope bruennichi]|uniref:Mutator-like transposase domain-containing protein n=1 Tax=Argiope bruennichi TaxID=94029 RepID=A0A8T0G5F4_ARGBR|nr:hypothetical protein HNY73_001413 [Argiope bruennichi]